jgi:phosphate:Na+ symporter
MAILFTLLNITGGLCLFLYGMKVMSDGIQRASGERLQRFLNLVTGNRFMGVFTGFAITAIIQSSSATTVMVVSLVNAGLLTLTQSIGVIMGANIGTTVTAWIVSLIGFSLKLSEIALPAVGIGFICSVIKWEHRNFGETILGFGLLFMGLDLLTKSTPALGNSFDFLNNTAGSGYMTYLIGVLAGMVMTLIVHSSSASTAIMLTMTFNGIISYEMAASMILGANIGTTIDAALASIGAKTNARRAALVHILFNVLGTCWALPLLSPLLKLVDIITPGAIIPGVINDPMVPVHLAMLHTLFNTLNALIFLPFVKQFGMLVTLIIKEEKTAAAPEHYHLSYISGMLQDTPEINIIRAEKEIRDMAGIVLSMFTRFSAVLQSLLDIKNKQSIVDDLGADLRKKEEYTDEMREQIGNYLMECAKNRLNRRFEHRVSQLLRVISDLENMTDDCCNLSYLLENGVKKEHIFEKKEMDALEPYLNMVRDFLYLVHENLGRKVSDETLGKAKDLEKQIDSNRNKLRKLSRKRLESGKDVKTELLFIELVRRIEKLGDYCYEIAEMLAG